VQVAHFDSFCANAFCVMALSVPRVLMTGEATAKNPNKPHSKKSNRPGA
jgi:hypothetical protein